MSETAGRMGIRARWRALLDHPLLRLELRRIGRIRWWPGRRFLLIYPALVGACLGCGLALAFGSPLNADLAALAAGAPAACTLGTTAWLLNLLLPWVVPALTASSVAREREARTLDLLRVSLVGERAIVLGKLAGVAARLWPALLALLFLSPFLFLARAMSGGSFGLFGGMYPLLLVGGAPLDALGELGGPEWWWMVGLAVAGGAIRWLTVWTRLAFHAAVGVYLSVRMRSAGGAIAASYGLLLALRVGLWVVSAFIGPTVLALFLDLVESEMAYLAYGLGGPVVGSLALFLAEAAGAFLLVRSAAQRLIHG